VRLLRAGKSYRQIGIDLKIAENTVKTHVQRVYAKLGVSSRYDLPRT
jgi:DNA-binding CsgD family transcriptional regulator